MNTLTKLNLETAALDAVSKIAPWLAPIPTAYLVGKATFEYLAWPAWVGVVTALTLEAFGLACGALALELRDWNQSKRKTDPAAPAFLAYVLMGGYLVIAIGLTVFLDIFPALAAYAPAIFPLFSLAGVTVLALRRDHARRVEGVKLDKAERKAGRQNLRPARVSEPVKNPSNVPMVDGLQAGKAAKKARQLDTLLDTYLDNPLTPISDAARRVGVSRQTVYTWLDELETAGRVHKNGAGVEVLR